MSQFRNISVDTRTVAYGVVRPIEVKPDDVVTVNDDVDENYVHQFEIWAPADAGAEAALSAWKTANQPATAVQVRVPVVDESEEASE